jgi:RNA-directed DNA polymerase
VTGDQKKRMGEVGKAAFVREEMTRLGYWPPSPEKAAEYAEIEALLKPLYDERAQNSSELREIEKEISEGGDIPRLLGEIRKKRIERVRAERAEKAKVRAAERLAKKDADIAWRKKTLPHLGVGVSGGLSAGASDLAELQKRGLPALSSAEDLAKATNLTCEKLAWLSYQSKADKTGHYARFTIPKKKGGLRVLASPKTTLRIAQSWILQEILGKLTPHPAAQAFAPGCSVQKNAALHVGKAVVVKTDLKDFFPSITWKRVKGLFEKLGYGEAVATLLALLCTDAPRVSVSFDGEQKFVAVGERATPQGACTSPAITNWLCLGLDARLEGIARSLGFAYTRYADDLTFSHDGADAPVGALLTLVRKIVAEEGLVINEEKTQVLRARQRQSVTGLVVNEGFSSGPRISRTDLKRFRAFLHHCTKDGLDAVSAKTNRDALAYARGYLAWIRSTRPAEAEKIQNAHPFL